MKNRILLVAAAGLAGLAASAEDFDVALDRAAVVFDRPNGPACMRTNILWNGTVETNRFTTGRPEYVMPFGAGDLSAMASFGADALELHLSQASWLTPRPTSQDDPAPQFKSPGHVQIRFADLKTNDFTRFAFKMDMWRGRLLLEAETVRGAIRAEMFGDRASSSGRWRRRDTPISRSATWSSIPTASRTCV